MRRRALVLAAVMAFGLAPGAALAARPPLPKCLTVTDPTGDTKLRDQTQFADSSLDVKSVTFAVRGDELVSVIRLVALAERPKYAYGDRFQFSFTSGADTVAVFYKRSATRSTEENVVLQQGVLVNNAARTSLGVSAVFDLVASTVTLGVKLRTLREALGRPVDNAVVTTLSVDAGGSYVGVHQTWDTAAAKREVGFRVAACH